MRLRFLLTTLFFVLAALALGACGGNRCRDACEREAACNGKLGLPGPGVDSCISTCESGTSCKNKDANLDCRANMLCENALGYSGEELVCASKCSTD